MTACPLDPASRRRLLGIAVVLVLVMVAVLLAAGCVSQGFGIQNRTLPKDKFVFLEHHTNRTVVTISGYCLPMNGDCYSGLSSPYTFDEMKGALNVTGYRNQKKPIDDSLILFYGDEYVTNRDPCNYSNINTGTFLYSLPWQSGNITVESVTQDGTVALRYDDVPVVLKPKEHWEKTGRKTENTPPLRSDRPTGEIKLSNGTILIGEASFECTEEITLTDTIYNAGVFDKTGIAIE